MGASQQCSLTDLITQTAAEESTQWLKSDTPPPPAEVMLTLCEEEEH